MARSRNGSRRKKNNKDRTREWLFVVCFFLFVLIALSIYFQRQTGILGRTVGLFFFRLFGWAAYALPVLLFIYSLALFFGRFHGKLARNILYLTALVLCAMLISGFKHSPQGSFSTNMEIAMEKGEGRVGPGLVGGFLSYFFTKAIGRVGIDIMTILLSLFFLLNLFDIPFSTFVSRTIQLVKTFFLWLGRKIRSLLSSVHRPNRDQEEDLTEEGGRRKRSAERRQAGAEKEGRASTRPADEKRPEPKIIDYREKELAQEARAGKVQPPVRKKAEGEEKGDQLSMEKFGLSIDSIPTPLYQPPVWELLKKPSFSQAADTEGLKERAVTIEETLSSFGIESEVVSIQRGPTVTLFELKPAAGIKVSRITNLADDLALALAARDIRIEAPIPGKPYVGIEVPNSQPESVYLSEILQSDPFLKGKKADIPVALGKSISGRPIVAEIANMPHLLIAGATGSGKSVCINTLIISILYKYSPAEVRMMLIDPKVVELSVYNGIPHLLIPVVTDPKKASSALYMAVQEMERRFKLFSQYSVRDIKGYHEKQKMDEDMENLPYIIVIIDELSDLMMVASKDVESHITRLAQMARACGIHLIIATQRPSVDVITGVIKANIPSRISFQVSSSVDSRTILDMGGAETLLGKGDMLYYPSNFSKPLRVQGAFVSDTEVSNIVDYVKEKNTVQYDKELIESIEKAASATSTASAVGEEEGTDPLMDEVLEYISHEETASISGLQRRFRIGYARAGRLVDQLEQMGVVSSSDGSKARKVLIDEPTLLSKEDENEPAE